MRILTGFILTTFFLVSFTMSKDSSRIIWDKDYSLGWKDFSGSPRHVEGIDAYTAYVIDFMEENNSYTIVCYFDKTNSWRIKKKETDYLLKHEQYHFNIAEVYARKIRKKIIELKPFSKKNEIRNAFNKIFSECNKTQIAYDKETNHSKNQSAQIKWETDIDQQLIELSGYTKIIIE